ncbi:MAG TPA: VWA domain-containing protein, partial [Thermoanaerobaculia bacterium]
MARLRLAAGGLALAANAALHGQGVREDVRVELVRVDVRVTDKKGNPVRDLAPEDLRLFIDGKPAKIEGLDPWSQVSLEPVREALAPLPGAPEPAPEAPPKPPPLFLAVLIDETSIATENRTPAMRRLDDALRRLPQDVRLQLLRNEGALRIDVPWTTDAEAIRAALRAPRKAGPRLGPPGQSAAFSFPAERRSATIDAMVVRRFQTEALGNYQEALRHFPSEPGRKALLLVTEGAPFLSPINVGEEAIARNDPTSASGGGRASLGDDIQARLAADAARDLVADSFTGRRLTWTTQMRAMTLEANRREIALYPFRAVDMTASIPPGNAATSPIAMSRTRAFHASGTQMEFVADETGGKALLSRGGLGQEIEEVIARRREGYLLTFRDPSGDHEDHPIRLESVRPGLSLAYRRTYRVRPPQDRLLDAAEDALIERRNDNRLGARVKIEIVGREGRQLVARVNVLYPAVAGTPIEPVPRVEIAGAVLSGEGYRSLPFH